MLLSVIIPAWQEARRMETLVRGARRLQSMLPYAVEILVVDDGSTDGTGALAKAAGLTVIRQEHRGKGAAVRTGMLAASGLYRMVADADWSMPPEQVLTMIPPALTGFDVAIASREAHGARRVDEPLRRHLIGRLFNGLVQRLILPGLEDTQCGFKVFRAEAARSIFSRSVEDGWAFDVEVLALARALGLRVVEVPIDWTYDADSRVRPIRDGVAMMRAILRIRRNIARGVYPRDVALTPEEVATTPPPADQGEDPSV